MVLKSNENLARCRFPNPNPNRMPSQCDEKVVKLEKEVLTHELTAREEQVHRQPRSMADSFCRSQVQMALDLVTTSLQQGARAPLKSYDTCLFSSPTQDLFR